MILFSIQKRLTRGILLLFKANLSRSPNKGTIKYCNVNERIETRLHSFFH